MDLTSLPDTMDLSLCDADLLGVRSVGDSPGPLCGVAPTEGPGNLSDSCEVADAIVHMQRLRERYEVSLSSLAVLAGCAQSTLVALLYPSSSRHRTVTSRRLLEQLLEAEFDLDLLEASALIGGCGTRRRLQALAVRGWSVTQLAEQMGCSATEVSRWRSARSISVERARAVRTAYEELAMTTGPSPQACRSALERGWVPPLAWDEESIDDPTSTPDLGAETPATQVTLDPVALERVISGRGPVPGLPPREQRAVAEQARAAGLPAAAVANCLGVSLRTVQRWDAARHAATTTPTRKAS